jgi:predicted O-methyltransferase YrrM
VTHLVPLPVRRLPFQTLDAVVATRDARRLAADRPDVLAALRNARDDAALRAFYDRYVTEVSNWEWAVSWPTARALDALCEALRPRRVLDLGSGFSTYVVCNWARRAGVETEIVSADTSDEWLDKTRVFLDGEGLSARLIASRDLASLPSAGFDLAFDDIGRIEARASVMPTIIRTMKPGGVVVLDDMNVRGYRGEVRSHLTKAGWPLYSLRPATVDAKGRFAMLTAAPR